jgi:pyruvate/2-oxoglutarate/acetoin dehydrogenase E1 component
MDAQQAVDLNEQVGEQEVVSYREALFQTMRDALVRNPNVILMGQGVDDHKGMFGSTIGLVDEFGADRVMDLPLAEEGTTGIAVGAALNGLYPIQIHIRADFVLLAMNQIVNLIAKYKYMFGGRFEVPLMIRMVVGRSWGQGAQHSQSLQSFFAHIPGLTVVMPASAQSILTCYPYLVEKYRGPVLVIEHRLMYDLEFEQDGVHREKDGSPLTSYKVRRGKDITIVATSIMVLEALRAAQHLDRVSNIDCEIIDLNCVSHPDVDMVIDSVKKTGKLLVADTSWQAYGVCAEVCRMVCEQAPSALKAPVVTMGMEPSPCPTAKTLEDLFYPNLQTLTDAVARLVTGSAEHGIPLPDETSMADVYKRFKGPF